MFAYSTRFMSPTFRKTDQYNCKKIYHPIYAIFVTHDFSFVFIGPTQGIKHAQHSTNAIYNIDHSKHGCHSDIFQKCSTTFHASTRYTMHITVLVKLEKLK